MNIKAAYDLLLNTARHNKTISYKEVIQCAEIPYSGQALSGALGQLFYDIVQAELTKNPSAPMLSAVALPTNGNKPSKGFFDLARELGRLEYGADEDTFWIEELTHCYAYWKD